MHEWLGIQFIAKRTAVISAMIYYPFVIVFLMAVARHSYFDRWDLPVGLIAILPSTRCTRSATASSCVGPPSGANRRRWIN